MVFSSVIFLFLFLPMVLIGNFLLPVRLRNLFLLIASLLFYAWGESAFVLVIGVSILVNYGIGVLIERSSGPVARRAAVTAGVLANLGLLIYFKYANFLVANLNDLLALAHIAPLPNARIHLPLGISFFTFQGLSYIIDIFRRHVKAQGNFINYALYKALFPQLIAGPIVRYADVSRQIVDRVITRADFAEGIRRFTVGLGKKVLIANIVAAQADRIFAIPVDQMPSSIAWIGIVCFFFQIYFDFGGYSDMAIGLGRMLGFRFLENFNYPYIAQTMTEFWQRWHISLSTWFRDYVFTPLGGYRCSRPRAYANLLAVFFLCGLWHGASWNFVLFGLYQGVFLIAERLIRAKHMKIFKSPIGNAYTVLVLLTTMVFFRADDLPYTWGFFKAMFGFAPPNAGVYLPGAFLPPEVMVALAAAVIGSTRFIPWLGERMQGGGDQPHPAGELFRQAACVLGLVAILVVCSMKLAAGTHNPFIYFRF